MARSRKPATNLTRLVQTHVREATATKLTAKAGRLGYKDAAYVRRLIEIDLGEIPPEEKT